MKLNMIQDEPKNLIIEFVGVDRGVVELVKDRLLDNKDVEFATVVKEHPEVGSPRLVIKTARNARGLVSKAVEKVGEDIREFSSMLPKN